jgi:hypothetical protein
MSLFGRLKRRLAVGWIVGLLKGAAEGKMGEAAKTWYWRAAGLKTWIGLALGVAWYALDYLSQAGECPSCGTYAGWVLAASGVLVSVGLLDKGLRAEAPRP